MARFFSIFLVMLAALAPVASAQIGAQSDELQWRYAELLIQSADDPSNLDVLFELGQVATSLEELEVAIGAYERLLIFNPDLPRVKLELGLLYFRLGAYAEAENLFAQVQEIEGLPPDVQANLDQVQEAAAAAGSPSQLDITLTQGVGHTDNANFGTPDEQVRLGNLILTVSEEVTQTAQVYGFVIGTVSHKYSFGVAESTGWETQANASLQFHATQDNLDSAFGSITTGPRLSIENRGDQATWRPYLYAGAGAVGETPYLLSMGGGIEAQVFIQDGLSVGGDVRLYHQAFQTSQTYPTLDVRDGARLEIRPALNARLQENLFLGLRGSIISDNAEQRSLGYTDVGLRGILSADLSPYHEFLQGISASTNAAYNYRTYHEADEILHPDQDRSDDTWSVGGALSAQLGPQVSAGLDLSYAQRRSNIELYDYNAFNVRGSLSYRF